MTSYITSYIALFLGVVAWALLLPKGRQIPDGLKEGLTLFGGAFLLGSCFINLVPHIFVNGFTAESIHLKIGASVLFGFLLQLLLEYMTSGIEHGHHHHENHSSSAPVTGLVIGLCIHAFLEGMPLIDSDGNIHQSLLYGIILHNIPIALVLIALFTSKGFNWWKTFALLSLFAIMTPLGSICNTHFITQNTEVQSIIMGIVVGILLHVSVSILFDKGHNQLSWWKLFLLIAAFAAAYFTPGCPEIYG